MGGIPGYSFDRESKIDRTLAPQALLAGIAERGADAVGDAHRGGDATTSVHKQRSGASALLERISVSQEATQALIHVRDYTKGHPKIADNNHPVRHGAVKGVHNGIIVNDEEIFAAHDFRRHAPGWTSAPEPILALADELGPARERLEGSRGPWRTGGLAARGPDPATTPPAAGRRP